MKLTLKLLMPFLLLSSALLSSAQGWNTNSGFLFYNQGNVGIGTSVSSNANLHIGKQEAPANSTGEIIRLSLQPFGHTGGPWNVITRDIPGIAFLDFQYAHSPIMTVGSNGNIGIGTLYPQEKLHVIANDNNRAIGLFGAKGIGDAGIYFDASDGDFVGMDYGSLLQKNDLSIELSNSGVNPINFKTADITRMTINGIGNVGIGTSDPQNLLDVKGTIRAKQVKVVGDSEWPDFVFKPDYQLKPLSEVEQFINTNGHLPEVPTAKQVEQNGVNLGEMNVKLLQKVEELTLYSIAQGKVCSELKENLTQQKKLSSELQHEMKELKELVKKKMK